MLWRVRPDTDFGTGAAAECLKVLPELLRLAYMRASVITRGQIFLSRLDCQEAASRRYLHPARSGYWRKTGLGRFKWRCLHACPGACSI